MLKSSKIMIATIEITVPRTSKQPIKVEILSKYIQIHLYRYQDQQIQSRGNIPQNKHHRASPKISKKEKRHSFRQ